MEATPHGLNKRFLDGPKQGRCLSQISARKLQGMGKLLRMEDPVKGVSVFKFIKACHINTKIKRIAGERCPDLSAVLAVGDGRSSTPFHEENGFVQPSVNHLNR